MSNSNAQHGLTGVPSPGSSWFEQFQERGLPRLRVALISSFGIETGAEATADAVGYAWEHRERLAAMANPVGYLFRVGQTAGTRHRRRARSLALPPVGPSTDEPVDPDLPRALAQLTDRQRVAVVLIHVNGWTYEEAADAMQINVSSVRTHVTRALVRLRRLLGQEDR